MLGALLGGTAKVAPHMPKLRMLLSAPPLTRASLSRVDDVAAAGADLAGDFATTAQRVRGNRATRDGMRRAFLDRVDDQAPGTWEHMKRNALPHSVSDAVMEFGLEGVGAIMLANSLASQEMPPGAPEPPALAAGLQAFGFGAGGSVVGRMVGSGAASLGARRRIGTRRQDERAVQVAAGMGGGIGSFAGWLPVPALEQFDKDIAAWQNQPTPQQRAGLPDPMDVSVTEDLRQRLLAAGMDPDALLS